MTFKFDTPKKTWVLEKARQGSAKPWRPPKPIEKKQNEDSKVYLTKKQKKDFLKTLDGRPESKILAEFVDIYNEFPNIGIIKDLIALYKQEPEILEKLKYK